MVLDVVREAESRISGSNFMEYLVRTTANHCPCLSLMSNCFIFTSTRSPCTAHRRPQGIQRPVRPPGIWGRCRLHSRGPRRCRAVPLWHRCAAWAALQSGSQCGLLPLAVYCLLCELHSYLCRQRLCHVRSALLACTAAMTCYSLPAQAHAGSWQSSWRGTSQAPKSGYPSPRGPTTTSMLHDLHFPPELMPPWFGAPDNTRNLKRVPCYWVLR